MVARTASPIAPPIWIAVVETPATSPECFSLTPETAASVAGTNVIPRPALRMISGGSEPPPEGGGARRVPRGDHPSAAAAGTAAPRTRAPRPRATSRRRGGRGRLWRWRHHGDRSVPTGARPPG